MPSDIPTIDARTTSGETYHRLCEHLVKHDTTGPPVYGSSDRITLLNQFRRHVLGSSYIQPRSALPLPFGNAEVGHHKVAIVSNKEVLRLDIPRDQSVAVDELYRADDIAIVEASIHLAKRSDSVDQLAKVSIGHQLEDEREIGRV